MPISPLDLDLVPALNSATKYPSIPTFHDLDARGGLLESGNPFANYTGMVHVTEKVDGANARLICIDDDWFIGSREDLLAAAGDRLHRPDHRIVEALLPYTGTWVDTEHTIYVYYVEVYGDRKLPGWKTYGDGQTFGVRLFDVAEIPLKVLNQPVEQIAAWRDHGGQNFNGFLRDSTLYRADTLQPVEWVPTLRTFNDGSDIPATVDGMFTCLQDVAAQTQVPLGGAVGRSPEGIVLRAQDRSIITKVRYENYNRTFQLRNQEQNRG